MPKSASCAFSSDSESAHASIRSSVASQLPVSRNSKPLTGAQSPPLQIHSERIHRIVVRFRAEVGHHWVFAGELCGPQESRGKATHLPRLSEIPPLVNSPGENLSARFLHSQFRFRVALGEPNSKRVNSTAPAVNGFPAQRRFKSTSHNVQFCKGLAASAAVPPFSVSETGALGAGCNRQGCDRTPRFLPSNSHILWLIRPRG